jgi:hypothetical protein
MDDELRRRTLDVVRISASVKDARRNGVCRLCGEKGSPRRTPDGKVDVFVLNYGREFAHRSCIEREKQADDNVIVVSTTNDVGNWYWSQWVMASEMADGESASGDGEKKPMRMPSRKWFERMTKVDDSCMSVGGLASRVADLESSVQAAGNGEPWQKAVLNEAVGIIVDGGDWGRGNDMNHGKLGAAVIWAEKEINRLRSLVVGLQSERDTVIRQGDKERLVRIGIEADRDFARREKESAIFHITELRTERDAAIREREAALARVAHLEDANRALKDAADAACDLLDESNARVAAMKAASGGGADCEQDKNRPTIGQMIEDTCKKLATAMRVADIEKRRGDNLHARVKELEAASGGGEQEPDAWGVVRDGNVESVTHRSFRKDADRVAEKWGETVVPLYRQPPQPRGWLTGEERDLIAWIVDGDAYTEKAQSIAKGLLARSTPPEVEIPEILFARLSVEEIGQLTAALAAAGVAVKEVSNGMSDLRQ